MSDSMKPDTDAAFWKRADSFIDLANEYCNTVQAGEVSASLLFAAARFNAFVVSMHQPNAAALQEARREALDYFTEQFRLMLEENLGDYSEHFADYVVHKEPSDAPTISNADIQAE